MKYILFILLMCCSSVAMSQEGWDDEPDAMPLVDPLAKDVEEIKQQLAALTASLASFKMPSPAACECKCDCPSVDEIRIVVREELERVTITVKTVAGVEKKVEVPLTTAKPQFKQIQPGDIVTAIDGHPVVTHRYRHDAAPVTQYTTPFHDMRVMESPGGFFGAVRSQCANGRCN